MAGGIVVEARVNPRRGEPVAEDVASLVLLNETEKIKSDPEHEKQADPDLDAEGRFFAALETMTLAEVQGAVLILSSEDGKEMLFQAEP